MDLTRREFLQLLAAAAAAGLPLGAVHSFPALDTTKLAHGGRSLYDIPPFGNVSLLHLTDSHAQLLPVYYREPSINIGVGKRRGLPPHLVGDHLLKYYGIPQGTREAHMLTSLDFVDAAKRYGKVGGYAHIATLVKQLRDSRPGALLLDGGDTWQGTATALWTKAQNMVDASLQLGVDLMTGHWEFTYGADRVMEIINGPFKGHIDFIAQNVKTKGFGDRVFPSYSMRHINGVDVAIIGQAFPYVPIAHPARFVPDWRFGIQEQHLQQVIDNVRKAGAQLVVLLSHNGMECDLKLAARVHGMDVILGGHTHHGVPRPVKVTNATGQTLVTNAGTNGKFLGVMDMDVRDGKMRDFRYRLLPVFSNMLPADPAMQALIDKHRAPYLKKLGEKFSVSEGLLYRRGNFNGSVDQLIVNALMETQDAQIAFSPGFRWGPTMLPGATITREALMEWTGITYPQVTINEYNAEKLKAILEDVCDNLFNPNPFYVQGGDMVRTGGLSYTCDPTAVMGKRISDLRVNGEPISTTRKYKVAGWASMADHLKGPPVWDVVADYLKTHQTIPALKINTPKLIGENHDPGVVASQT